MSGEPLRCLEKKQDCNSEKCEKIVECKEHLNSNCFSIAEQRYHSNGTSNTEIVYAGCLPGSDDCRTPLEFSQKLNSTLHQTHEHSKFTDQFLDFIRNYTVHSTLLEVNIQDKCIAYAKEANDHNWFSKNNRTFCCCSKSMCNIDIFHTLERNPNEVYAKNLNPSFKSTILSQFTPSPKSTPSNFTQRDIYMIGLTSFALFLIFGLSLILYLCSLHLSS